MIEFCEKEHKYTYEGEEFASVTHFLKRFKVPFDSDRWSNYVANRDGKTQQEILDMWAENAKKACEFGTKVHAYAEGVIKGTISESLVLDGKLGTVLGHVNSILKEWGVNSVKHSEVIVWNKELKLAGTIDVVRNVDGGVAILDWKTNKQIKLVNHYQNMLHPLTEYHDCNYNHYLFQLNMYKYLYEKQFGEKVVALGLVHLSEGGYELFDMPIMSDDVEELLKIRKGEI